MHRAIARSGRCADHSLGVGSHSNIQSVQIKGTGTDCALLQDFISCPSLAHFPCFSRKLLEVDELDAILLCSFRTQMPDLQWLVMRAQK